MCDEEYKFIEVLGKGGNSAVCMYEEVATG